MTPDSKKGRPGGGDLSPKNSDSHPQGYDMTSGQPTLRDLYAGYPTDDEAAAFGGVRYLAPRGYVALFSDGEIWDVAGFDYRGNPLIRVRGGALVRANAYPAYVAQGFEELLARSA